MSTFRKRADMTDEEKDEHVREFIRQSPGLSENDFDRWRKRLDDDIEQERFAKARTPEVKAADKALSQRLLRMIYGNDADI